MNCPTCHRPITAQRQRCYYCTGRQRDGIERACESCGRSIYVQTNQLARGEGRFCSYACKHNAARGVERVTGSTYIRKDGYRVVKIGIRQRKLEHRLVVESAIGRLLRTDEEVHHKNGDKLDNRLENLVVLSPSEHQHAHPEFIQRMRRRITLTCEFCGNAFERRPKLAGQRFCSRSCRSKATQAALAAKRIATVTGL